MTTTYKCQKCNGSGYLNCYAGIANGVCFSCAGRGIKVGTAPIPGVLFPITAINKETGVREMVLSIKAKSASEALKKAVITFSRGHGYIAESAQVAA